MGLDGLTIFFVFFPFFSVDIRERACYTDNIYNYVNYFSRAAYHAV